MGRSKVRCTLDEVVYTPSNRSYFFAFDAEFVYDTPAAVDCSGTPSSGPYHQPPPDANGTEVCVGLATQTWLPVAVAAGPLAGEDGGGEGRAAGGVGVAGGRGITPVGWGCITQKVGNQGVTFTQRLFCKKENGALTAYQYNFDVPDCEGAAGPGAPNVLGNSSQSSSCGERGEK